MGAAALARIGVCTVNRAVQQLGQCMGPLQRDACPVVPVPSAWRRSGVHRMMLKDRHQPTTHHRIGT